MGFLVSSCWHVRHLLTYLLTWVGIIEDCGLKCVSGGTGRKRHTYMSSLLDSWLKPPRFSPILDRLDS